MAEISEALIDFNAWWKEEFKIEFKDRLIYEKIKKFISQKQILAFTGLRRVGKTTLMMKIIEDSIKKGMDPKNILFFSFDEFREIEIKSIIKEYERLMKKDIRKEKYIILFDEIQKLNDWENQLKSIYDAYWKNLKIIISGSESLFIKRKSKETLAGRIFEFKIDLLSFKEFLIFKEVMFKPINIYEKELIKLFEEFILIQGFPELVNIKEKEIIKKYIQESIVEKIIYKDIPRLFKIKDISILESILNLFMEDPGQLIEISELSKELKISRQSLSNYLNYLEKSFLIRKLYNFSRSKRKVERKLKKYYPVIVSTDLLFKEDSLSKSKIFEWLIVNQLNAEFFWRDSYKNEVDVVIYNKEIIPIEIKYGKLDTKNLLVFMRKFNINNGYIISFEKEMKKKINKKTVFIVPAFKFLLRR